MWRPTRRLRRYPVFRVLTQLCRQYLRWYGNASYKPAKNGERWLLEQLRGEGFTTIIDVGANVGQWATLAATTFPAATIYALEIVPATFERLRAATSEVPGIRPFCLGLAAHTGLLRIRYPPLASAHATLTDYPHPWVSEPLECDVTTGDVFVAGQGLSTAQFVKIDVEGAEHLVLQGFARALSEHRIRFVQFEYGRVNILTGFLLKHFYDLFAGYGYVVGKIYPDYVDFRGYELADEDFLGPNFLACCRDEPLIARLRGD